jgi:hypothetical protein
VYKQTVIDILLATEQFTMETFDYIVAFPWRGGKALNLDGFVY